MKRFRYTIIAVCLVLLYLGWNDIALFWRNQTPAAVSLPTLIEQGAPREWLHVTGGTFDLEQAISTSGSIELDALLVPLKTDPASPTFQVLVETRDPRMLELFSTYHFQLDSIWDKEKYLQEHAEGFHPQRPVTGMLVTGLVASGNRDKLMDLARSVGMEVPDGVLFISEGKTPSSWRGFFFAGVGLLGLLRVLSTWRDARSAPAGQSDMTIPPKE